jgi:hypothetical protein
MCSLRERIKDWGLLTGAWCRVVRLRSPAGGRNPNLHPNVLVRACLLFERIEPTPSRREVMIKARPATESLEVGKVAKICPKDHQALSIKKTQRMSQ